MFILAVVENPGGRGNGVEKNLTDLVHNFLSF
jgi:hypothetical protein